MAHVPGVPHERLEHRLDFLESRAAAHIDRARDVDRLSEREEMLARACAATLWRDAGCVALLMNEVPKALELLTRSGRELLALGLPSGARLVALGSLQESSAHFHEFGDVVEGTREQWTRSEARERGTARDRKSSRERRSREDQMGQVGRESPRQVFSMMQADWLTTEIPFARHREREEPMRAALERNKGYPAGETGLSIGSYSQIAEWFTEQRRSETMPPEQVRRGVETLAAARAEHLRAAQLAAACSARRTSRS